MADSLATNHSFFLTTGAPKRFNDPEPQMIHCLPPDLLLFFRPSTSSLPPPCLLPASSLPPASHFSGDFFGDFYPLPEFAALVLAVGVATGADASKSSTDFPSAQRMNAGSSKFGVKTGPDPMRAGRGCNSEKKRRKNSPTKFTTYFICPFFFRRVSSSFRVYLPCFTLLLDPCLLPSLTFSFTFALLLSIVPSLWAFLLSRSPTPSVSFSHSPTHSPTHPHSHSDRALVHQAHSRRQGTGRSDGRQQEHRDSTGGRQRTARQTLGPAGLHSHKDIFLCQIHAEKKERERERSCQSMQRAESIYIPERI
jgi:hypothetical protein